MFLLIFWGGFTLRWSGLILIIWKLLLEEHRGLTGFTGVQAKILWAMPEPYLLYISLAPNGIFLDGKKKRRKNGISVGRVFFLHLAGPYSILCPSESARNDSWVRSQEVHVSTDRYVFGSPEKQNKKANMIKRYSTSLFDRLFYFFWKDKQ